MSDSQKLVLMIQPTRLQGLIWHTVLKSQHLAVIWESPEFNIEENLSQLEAAGLPLPNLLLIDVRLKDFNPYAFCRSCRDRYPQVKIILTNAAQREIEPSERQWAMNQGASDFVPGFRRDNLVTSVTSGVKRLLQVLDDQPLDNGALIAVLFAMKRELESRQASGQGAISGPDDPPSGDLSGLAAGPNSGPLGPVSAPGTHQSHQNGHAKSPTELPAEITEPPVVDPEDPGKTPPPKSRRRYRGRTY